MRSIDKCKQIRTTFYASKKITEQLGPHKKYENFKKVNPDMKEPINQWLAFIDMERRDLLEMSKKKNSKIIKDSTIFVESYIYYSADSSVSGAS